MTGQTIDLTVIGSTWTPGAPPGPETLSATSLTLPAGITLDEWATIMRRLLATREAADWWIGDCLAEGWARFATDPDTGQEISTGAAHLRTLVASMTTLDLDVLRAARDTARRTPPRRRRRTLSFDHHQQVLDLDDRRADELLDLAEADGLQSGELRAAVRKATKP